MHMADALISPAVGGAIWAASAGLVAYSARKVSTQADDRIIPLMGVSGAFVFAAQMINFGIPGTGSSGHIGGGLLLAALLGPHAAFLVVSSILATQALFFADGGLLALGCNIFNLGVFPCFIAYPLIFRPIMNKAASYRRLLWTSVVAAVMGLELGAFGVVLQTTLSGITELPLGKFVLLMLPIHLAIGIVEGLATAAVLGFVWKARPEILKVAAVKHGGEAAPARSVALALLIASIAVGGALSWFASAHPDGLEWAVERTSGSPEIERSNPVHDGLARLQKKIALLPDYNFKSGDEEDSAGSAEPWPAVSAGTSVSGIVGSVLVLLVAGAVGYVLRFVNLGRSQT